MKRKHKNKTKRNKTRNKTRNKRTLNRKIKKKTKKRTKQRTKRYRNVNLIKQVGGRNQPIYSSSGAGDWYLYTGARMPAGLGTAQHDYLYDKNKWKLQTPPVEERRGDGFIFISDISFVESANHRRQNKLKDISRWWPMENRGQPYGTTDEALRDPNILERIVFEIRDHTRTLEIPIIQGIHVSPIAEIKCGGYGCAFEAAVTSADFSGNLVIKQQCNRRTDLISFDKRKSNEIMIMAKIRQNGDYANILQLKGLVEDMPTLVARGRGPDGSPRVGAPDFARERVACETIAIPLCGQSLNSYLDQSPPAGRSKQEIFTLIEHVLDAIIYLHSIGILHNDIHGNNIMECFDGTFGSNRFKLIDFGLSSFIVRDDQKYLDFEQFNDYVLTYREISERNVTMAEIHAFLSRNYGNNPNLMRGLELS